MKERTREI